MAYGIYAALAINIRMFSLGSSRLVSSHVLLHVLRLQSKQQSYEAIYEKDIGVASGRPENGVSS